CLTSNVFPCPMVKLYLPPRGILSPSNEEDPLDYYYQPIVGRLYVSRINMALGLLKRDEYSSILEIGYGSGVLMPTLDKLSDEIYGVDLSCDPDDISGRLAKLRCYPKLSRGEADKLLFDDNSLDLVIAISVLEHIKEIQPFLAEIHRVLKPSGTLLVGMPAVNKTMEYLFRAIGFAGIDAHHVTSPEEMHRAAAPMFSLKSTDRLPNFLPPKIYLYKSFCFEK
ncbi:MAG: class I SAM-dependent methyltransferase, partial [Leptolyngbyaceae cyanobacterium CAN_BIN12]|nr:class I SAM-dependent methyltransferase [Leptolyngbyaceae cyanobacterium CAN_BIN12]